MKITAAVSRKLHAPITFENVELQEPKADEVLIKIVATGICHTDAEAIKGHAVPLPAVLGHEGSGIVEKVGTAVKSINPGDHVVLSFAYCGECENCLEGHQNGCEHTGQLNFGGQMADGTYRIYSEEGPLATFFGQSSFATYAVANKNNVVKVDPEVDLALLGPLGCGIQTGSGAVMNTLNPKVGSTIAIFGAGAVGLSAVMAAKIVGCSEIIVIDIHENRLNLAKELGATTVLNSKEHDIVDEITKLIPNGVHYALETTGVPIVIKQALQSIRPLGVLGVIGIAGDVTFNIMNEILVEGKTVKGILQGDSIPQLFIPALIDYYKKGLFPFDKLVKFYPFEDINQAFEDSKNGSTIKPIVKIS